MTLGIMEGVFFVVLLMFVLGEWATKIKFQRTNSHTGHHGAEGAGGINGVMRIAQIAEISTRIDRLGMTEGANGLLPSLQVGTPFLPSDHSPIGLPLKFALGAWKALLPGHEAVRCGGW
jgi:hypothetical protein